MFLGLLILVFFSLRVEKNVFVSPLGPEKAQKFAVMSDLHSDIDNLQEALVLAQKEGAEFVILAGDLTTLGKKDELIKIKNILIAGGLPYYVLVGNHDYWFGRQTKADIFGEILGPDYQSFPQDKLKFILFSNSYGLSAQEMIWLKGELADCLRIDCLVVTHEPLNHAESAHVMGENDPQVASQAGELVDLLVKNKVKGLFAGHLHFGSQYELGGLKTTIVGSLADERNWQTPRFLLVTQRGEELTQKEIILDTKD